MLHKSELKPSGFRELTENEMLAVSGGTWVDAPTKDGDPLDNGGIVYDNEGNITEIIVTPGILDEYGISIGGDVEIVPGFNLYGPEFSLSLAEFLDLLSQNGGAVADWDPDPELTLEENLQNYFSDNGYGDYNGTGGPY